MKKCAAALSALILVATTVFAAPAKRNDKAEYAAPPEAVRAWRDLGFEIFIHWSAGTVFQGRFKPEGKPPREFERDLWGEWIKARAGIPQETYDAALKTWNPKDFNADEWADIIAASGGKLVVYVAKHHDGFAHFKSAANDFNTYDWGAFHTDVFGELCKALHKRGIKTGFYYSHGKDWRHNTRRARDHITREEREYFEKIVYPHLRELSTKYGRQTVAWFDLGAREEFAKKCIEIVRKYNPEIMVSSRVGRGLGDFATGGDAYIPVTTRDAPWETCMTFSYHWAWYPEDRKYKTPEEVIRMLAEVRSKGGNLLLNIGPDVRGRITFREKTCLRKVGEWLKRNGDSIYAASPSPYDAGLPWGFCTTKPGKLFLHILELPTLDYVYVPGLKSPISRAYVLADEKKKPLKVEADPYGAKVYLYDAAPDSIDYRDTVVVLLYEDQLDIDKIPVLDNDLDTRFLPQLAAGSGPLKVTDRSRLTPVIDHPGVQEPRYYAYAFGFGRGAKATWKFHCAADNYFYLIVKYANMTDKTVKGLLTVNGKKHTIDLPPTFFEGRVWECFKTAVTPKPLAILKGSNQTVSFELAPESLDAALEKPAVRRLRASFMLNSLSFKAVYPPPYEGYGENPNMTKVEPEEGAEK